MSEKPEILQIGPMMGSVESALSESYVVHRLFEAADKEALLAQIGQRIRAVATDGHHGYPPAHLPKTPNLEVIASYGVGYDAIDTDACRAAGVRVTNTPDVLNDAVAELAMGLMLALCRQIPQADQFVRTGRWADPNWGAGFPLTGELTGKTVGVLGLGRIGKEIARRAQVFKMKVVYHGRNRQIYEPYDYYDDLTAMARDVDWLVVIAPGSASTKGIVSRTVLEALGPQGMLVNVARGGLIDEDAMHEMLQSGALGGAALDVFVDEPGSSPKFAGLENVVLSPHQGSATYKTRQAMGDLVVANLAAHFRGDPLMTPVV